ncbi:MAG: flippase [Candidatus Magasanikbacteria bacterium]
MSVTKQVAHNTFFQMLGKIISTFFGLAAVAMMTRYLGQEKFGWYITTISFLGVIGIFIDFGMTPVTAQILGENKFDKTKIFNNLVTFRFLSAIFFLSLAPLIALFFPYPNTVKIAISFTAISFVAISLNQVFIGFLQEKLQMHIQAIGEIIGRFVLVIGLLIAIYNQAQFLTIMLVIILASIAYTTTLYLFIRKKTKLNFSFDKNIWREIIIKMWPIAVAIIFNVVYLRGDLLLLSFFGSQTDVGIYGAAYRVIDIVVQTAMMIMGVMLPLLATSWVQKNKEEFKQRYQVAFDAMMILAIPMFTGLFLLSHKIMVLVAGQDFFISGNALQILSLAILGVFWAGIFGHLVVAVNLQKEVLWVYISNAIITFTGYMIFIPKYGMYGAAWMTVFSEWYTAVMVTLVARKNVKEKINYKFLTKVIFSSIIMGVFIILLNKIQILILITISIAIYTLMLFATRAVSKGQMKDILSLKS